MALLKQAWAFMAVLSWGSASIAGSCFLPSREPKHLRDPRFARLGVCLGGYDWQFQTALSAAEIHLSALDNDFESIGNSFGPHLFGCKGAAASDASGRAAVERGARLKSRFYLLFLPSSCYTTGTLKMFLWIRISLAG